MIFELSAYSLDELIFEKDGFSLSRSLTVAPF